MLSRWPFARLKAAQRALYNGRIDEAYEAVTQPDLRANRGAQKLLDELSKPLLARARLHAEAGRYRRALEDLDKLQAIGRGGSEADEVRRHAMHEMKDRRERRAEHDDAYARAANDLRAGRLDSGRVAIERVEDSGRREQLQDELDVRVERSEQILEQAREALEHNDALTACRMWEDACQRHGRGRASDELARRLGPALRKTLDGLLDGGRLEEFVAALRGTEMLRTSDPALGAYEKTAALCSRAARQLTAHDHAALRETLLRLQASHGGASWVKDGLKSVGAIVDAHDELLASPLGPLAPSVEKTAGNVMSEPAKMSDTLTQRGTGRRDAGGHGRLARTSGVDDSAAPLGRGPLLMLVDGTGSCVLLTRDLVRIGRAGGGLGVDVPIPADIQSHHADLVREGDDYFLLAHGPARVNRREVRRALLRHGDRVTLGANAKFVFHKPSAKSESAVLKMSDRCRLPQDVSHVILFRDTCLVGPQSSSHVRTREGESRLVLFDRAGYVYVRETKNQGVPAGRAEPLKMDETRQYGDVRLTVKAYEPDEGGRLA